MRTDNFDHKVFINGGKFRRYHGDHLIIQIFDIKTLLLNARDFFRVIGSIGASLKIIRKFHPGVVFSKGGFVVVPVGIAARLRRVPIVTHDSDTVPGLANRIVGRWAKVHATGMPAKYYPYPKSSIEYTGIPLDPRIKKITPNFQSELKKQLGLPKDSQVLLLSGGGNGSKRLNELMVAISRNLLQSYPDLHVIHVSGSRHEADMNEAYSKTLPRGDMQRVKVVGFSPDFYSFVGAADLVITRGGATTLAELAVSAKACIIIPSPFLAGGHQLKNTQELAARDAAVIASEDIEPDELLAMVSELLNDGHRRQELANNLHTNARQDAATKLAEIILKTAETKR